MTTHQLAALQRSSPTPCRGPQDDTSPSQEASTSEALATTTVLPGPRGGHSKQRTNLGLGDHARNEAFPDSRGTVWELTALIRAMRFESPQLVGDDLEIWDIPNQKSTATLFASERKDLNSGDTYAAHWCELTDRIDN